MSSYFNQTWSFSINFCQRPRYKISQHSVQWEPRCGQTGGRTDRHNETNRRFSLFMRTCLQRCPFVRQRTSVYTATDARILCVLKILKDTSAECDTTPIETRSLVSRFDIVTTQLRLLISPT
jgi:hypothetical protein